MTGDTLQVSIFRHDSNLAPRRVVSGFSWEVGLQRFVSFTVVRIPYDSYRGRQRRNHLPKFFLVGPQVTMYICLRTLKRVYLPYVVNIYLRRGKTGHNTYFQRKTTNPSNCYLILSYFPQTLLLLVLARPIMS